jgi:uncharacterized protein (UPF0333 family)
MKINISNGAKIAITLVGVLVFLLVMLMLAYINAVNYGVTMEKKLDAQYINNQNILAQYSQKIGEVAQVPEMYKNDVKEVVTAAISGRYGTEGSKAVFQWLKEQNPQLDSKVYVKLQQIIEAGRNEFQNAQTQMIDTRRSYETNLGYVWTGFWLRMAGYPKTDLTKYSPIITDKVEKIFKNGKEEGPIKLR